MPFAKYWVPFFFEVYLKSYGARDYGDYGIVHWWVSTTRTLHTQSEKVSMIGPQWLPALGSIWPGNYHMDTQPMTIGGGTGGLIRWFMQCVRLNKKKLLKLGGQQVTMPDPRFLYSTSYKSVCFIFLTYVLGYKIYLVWSRSVPVNRQNRPKRLSNQSSQNPNEPPITLEL